MWRPAHGATSRPGPCRPASGYGRALGRPGPPADDPLVDEVPIGALAPAAFGELVGQVRVTEQEAEAPTPVTP